MSSIVKTTTIEKNDLGNNETASVSLSEMSDGTFMALTYADSRTFKTYAGAVRWLARRGYEVPAAA